MACSTRTSETVSKSKSDYNVEDRVSSTAASETSEDSESDHDAGSGPKNRESIRNRRPRDTRESNVSQENRLEVSYFRLNSRFLIQTYTRVGHWARKFENSQQFEEYCTS
jgi:hypothetical protein